MPKTTKKYIDIIIDGKTPSEDNWKIILPISHEGHTRYVVENEAGTHTAIVNLLRGEYYITSGPTSWVVAEDAAAGIIFNRGTAVDNLKAAAAGFLLLTRKLRAFPKFTHPFPYENEPQNPTDEGV